MLAPPRPPSPPDEPEALIREARARQRRRRIGLAALVASAAAGSLAIWAVVPGSSTGPRGGQASGGALASSRRCPPGNLGTLAFARGGTLQVLDLHGCRVRTLVRSQVRAPVEMSSDGRWVAFRGGYVPVAGGRVRRFPGTAVWSPRGDLLAVVTRQRGLELGRAGGPLRRLLPDGWGAWTAVFSPGGRRLAVSRTVGHGHVEQIWLVGVTTGARRLLFREPGREGAPALLQGFSPDGRWLLFWKDPYASASILADGVPLLAVPVTGGRPRLVTRELYYGDYLSWCDGRLVYVVDHGGRTVTQGDGIAIATPPGWQSRTLLAAGGRTSWTAFSCNGSGALAVAAGPTNDDEPFGHEHRAVWLVRGRTAHPLPRTLPPRGRTDEWPSWSADGRWLLFVRSRWTGRSWPGTLYALDVTEDRLVGPIAPVGTTENYYGHYGWPSQISWHRP